MTNLESSPGLLVEKCCDGANVIHTIKQWGVQWPDGVRAWNNGGTLKCECSKCGRELKFTEGGRK